MNARTHQHECQLPMTTAATRYIDVWLREHVVQFHAALAARLFAIRAWRVRQDASRRLHRFDDALLKDIGLCRSEIDSRLRELDGQGSLSLKVRPAPPN